MKRKVLLVFDFDHTIIDDNSDTFIQKLVPNGKKLPENICKLYRSSGWILFMNSVLEFLHSSGVSSQQILECLLEIPWTPGMLELIKRLKSKADEYDMIIISDSNSMFIEKILEGAGVKDCFRYCFTNVAHVDCKGLLHVEPYHHQDWCELSTDNMCKGHILDSYLKKCKDEKDVVYKRVIYVGDGANDFCPSLRLSAKDLVCARRHYSLLKRIEENRVSNNYNLLARVLPWNTGFEILDEISHQS